MRAFTRRSFLVAGAWLSLGALVGAEKFPLTGSQKPYDVIVIGGSFAGLAAALQIARSRRTVLVLDSGQPRNRFAKAVHGFLGQDGRAPGDILADSARQLLAYPSAELRTAKVRAVEGSRENFQVALEDGNIHQARRLVLATGVEDILPPIPGLRERWGVSVLHCPYCHGYEVGRSKLGVLACHSLSIKQSLLVPDWGPTTYFTQARYEPSAEELTSLTARGVTLERTPVVEFLGKSPELEAVKLSDGRILPLGAMFLVPESRMASPLAANLGCEFDKGPLGLSLRTAGLSQTTVPGVFAAGDIANAIQKVTMAAASGVSAGLGAHQSLVGA